MPKFQIDKEAGLPLRKGLHALFKGELSVRKIKNLIDERGCLINGKVEIVSTKCLQKGDSVEIREDIYKKVLEKDLSIKIIFEDEFLLVIDKPSGLVSDAEQIQKNLKASYPLYLVHRLDKDTSGVMLLAKSLEAQEAIEDLFRERKIEKEYLALVRGLPRQEGIIETLYASVGEKHGVKHWSGKVKEGVTAITEWKLLANKEKVSLVLCMPKTGRTHQIRVHFYEMGYPIIGDKLYGHTWLKEINSSRLGLHASKLSFTHPFTSKECSFEVKAPKYFEL